MEKVKDEDVGVPVSCTCGWRGWSDEPRKDCPKCPDGGYVTTDWDRMDL